MSAEYFLDSSAAIERFFRARDISRRVPIPLGAIVKSSVYVLFEVGRGYIQALLLLHNKAREYAKLEDAHEFAHGGQQMFRRYRREAMLGAFGDYLAHLRRNEGPTVEAMEVEEFCSWLQIHIRQGWRKLRALATFNQPGCRSDLPNPQVLSDKQMTHDLPSSQCGEVGNCRLLQYIQAYLRDFQALATTLENLPRPDDETQRRVTAIRSLAATRPDQKFDAKHCYHAGDALIAHEAGDSAVIVSKNEKHFSPICQILGRQLKTYSSSARAKENEQ